MNSAVCFVRARLLALIIDSCFVALVEKEHVHHFICIDHSVLFN